MTGYCQNLLSPGILLELVIRFIKKYSRNVLNVKKEDFYQKKLMKKVLSKLSYSYYKQNRSDRPIKLVNIIISEQEKRSSFESFDTEEQATLNSTEK